jgi:hypothetical protein
LELRVVRAILRRSSWNCALSALQENTVRETQSSEKN